MRAHADDSPPAPTSPGGAVALLKWCWTHKDAQRYRDLFTADYQFIPQAPDLPWNRDDELGAASGIFGTGTATQPGANNIALDWLGSPPPQPGTAYLPGEPYPSYQQFIAIAAIAVTRTDNSAVTGQGPTMFHLIRGDLASIPQEMRDRGIGPDPNRWYIQKWEDMPAPYLGVDHAPAVTAPESLAVHAGHAVTMNVSVFDPDYDPVVSLAAVGTPASEGSFTRSADNLSGHLIWTPGASEAGTFFATFTASNRIAGTATTKIVVTQGLPPIASLTASPTSGIPGLQVRLDASGSRDPDGVITNYHYNFGDETSQDSKYSVVNHSYLEGRFTPSVTVTDNDGQTSTVSAPAISVDMLPIADFTVNVMQGTAPLTVTFDTSPSHDPDGTIVRYEMGFGDGSAPQISTTSTTFTHTYTTAGTFPAGLSVTDNQGATGGKHVWIEVTLVDRPPVVNAPSSAVVNVGKTMQFTASATDPDNQPASLTVSSLPAGATFTFANSSSGALSWTPTAAAQGTYSVTFTASNALSSSKTVTLTVKPPNVLVASLAVTPTNGVEPLPVHLSAAGSHDDNAQIVSYRFNCGDGTVVSQSSPELDHTYAGGHWQPSVMVTDDSGDQDIAVADVQVVPLGSFANLARNPSFEVDTRYWNSYAGSLLERVAGGHDGNFGLQVTGPPVINGSFGVNDSPDNIRWTVAAGIHYRYTAWVRSASSGGQAKLRVTEYLIAGGVKLGMATSSPVRLSPDWQQLTVDYTTTSANATLDFQVRDWPIVPSEVFITDDIAVRNVTAVGAGTGMAAWYDGEHDPMAMEARLVPSPMRGSGTLRFMTSESGPLRVELLDLAGRRVRGLMNQSDAPAGLYELPITRVGDDGRRLGAGIYFWRVQGKEGTKTGRFVMLQ